MSNFIAAIVGFIQSIFSIFSPAYTPAALPPALNMEPTAIVRQVIAPNKITVSEVLNAYVPALGYDSAFQLKNGSYEASDIEPGMDMPAGVSFSAGSIKFADVTRDGKEDAIVPALWCGGSCGTVIYVFDKKNGKTQAIAKGGGAKNVTGISIDKGFIIVTSTNWPEADYKFTQAYRILDGEFVEVAPAEVLDEDTNKSLPSASATLKHPVFIATPEPDLSPLTVIFSAKADLGRAYSIDFGDGTTSELGWENCGVSSLEPMDYCPGYLKVHEYKAPGTYITRLGSTCTTRSCVKITWHETVTVTVP